MKRFWLLFRIDLFITLVIALAGQILFAFFAPSFTAPSYEGRIYSTTAVMHQQEDLHKLNEAAHYFGQTIIGWLKFPNFLPSLKASADLPADVSISAHIQERQNIVFIVRSKSPVKEAGLLEVKDFIQKKVDEYNSVSRTEFVLSNLDYELVKIQRSYGFGALATLLATLVIGVGLVYIRRELGPFSR